MHLLKILPSLVANFLFALLVLVSRTDAAIALPGINVQWPQQISISAVTSFFQSEPDPSQFWDQAKNLGDKVFKYTNDLLIQITKVYPSVKSSISSLQNQISSTLHDTGLQTLRSDLESLNNHLNLNLSSWSNEFSDDLSMEFEVIMAGFKAEFPPPAEAPNHDERVTLIENLMDRIEEGLVKVTRRYGIPENDMRRKFGNVRPRMVLTLVIIGDLAEQHPVLFEAVLFSATTLFLPEVWIFRPILSCFGFGPLGPVKGSTAAWAQRRFFGAVVEKGSWFARLQAAGMMGWHIRVPKIVLGVIGGGVGAGFGLCRR